LRRFGFGTGTGASRTEFRIHDHVLKGNWHSIRGRSGISGVRTGRFDDLRDAATSARIAKRWQPLADVIVADAPTKKMIVEIAT
jgi:hypothetical protein